MKKIKLFGGPLDGHEAYYNGYPRISFPKLFNNNNIKIDFSVDKVDFSFSEYELYEEREDYFIYRYIQ